MPEHLESDVRDFLRRYVESIEQLEALLLLRSREARDWTAREAAGELGVSTASARASLEALARRGLLARAAGSPARYRYDPDLVGLDTVAQRVAQAYESRPMAVIEYLFSRPLQDLRSFADAFRLKERKK
jgi:predicted ArsR family transcriptional regulator